MTWTLSDNGTKTATVSGSVTVSNGSPPALFAMTNTCAAGDMVVLSGTTPPGNFSFGTVYYVISAGLSSSQFELSATPGGSAIAYSSAGSVVVATIEHVLAIDTNNGTFVSETETSNMALGDLVELRVYTITLSGGSLTQAWKGTFQHAQINNHKVSPPVASDQSIQCTLKQLAGTGRAFAWKMLRI